MAMGKTLIFKPVKTHTRVYEPASKVLVGFAFIFQKIIRFDKTYKCRKSIRIVRRSVKLSMGGRMRHRRGAICHADCGNSMKVGELMD